MPKSSASLFQKRSVMVGLIALGVGLGVVWIISTFYDQGASAARGKPTSIAKAGLPRASTVTTQTAPQPPPPPKPPTSQSSRPKTKPVPSAENTPPERLRGFAPSPKLSPPKPVAEEPEAKQSEAETPDPVEEDITPVYEPDVSTEFAKSVADVRLAMVDRDLDAACKYLEIARDQAETEADRGQIDRLTTILDNLTQFWGGIQTSMSKLEAAEELVIRDTRIVVVDSGEDFLNVKVTGRVHRFRLKTLPTSLIMALVHQYFGTDTGTKAIIGTFLAVDPGGDRSLAREYWLEAAQDGIDTEKLLPEIDAMPPIAVRHEKKSLQKNGVAD